MHLHFSSAVKPHEITFDSEILSVYLVFVIKQCQHADIVKKYLVYNVLHNS